MGGAACKALDEAVSGAEMVLWAELPPMAEGMFLAEGAWDVR